MTTTQQNLIWGAYLVTALRYFLFAGLSFMVFYIWKKQKFAHYKIQPAEPKKSAVSTELKYSISTIFIFATVILLILRSPLSAYTKVYHDFSEHSTGYFIFSIFAAIFIHDTYFYWTHRLMHWKVIFPYVHHIHHRSHNPTPLAAFSFHPIEALIEIGVLPVIVLIMPVHPIALSIFGTYMIVMNVIGHLGFELMPEVFMRKKLLRMLNTSTHHNMHHHYSKCNYGLYFSIWDRLMGTLHKQYETQFKNIAQRARKSKQQKLSKQLNIETPKNMKTNPNLIRTGTLMAAMLLCTFGCKKDSSSNNSSADEQTTIDLASSSTGTESLYDDAFDVAVQSGEQSGVSTNSVSTLSTNSTGTLSSYSAVACATVTLSPQDPSVFPKTMTIDYGSGCTSTNGITRKGKLVVSLSGELRTPGSVISITFDNYSVNGYILAGTYALTPVAGTGGGVNYTVAVTNGSITLPTGATYAYTANETFTQTGGTGTPTVTDDTYSITGSFTYSGNGNSIAGTVTTPLVRTADCKNITSGIISFTYKNLTGTLDFGSGACDNQATVTVGPKVSTVTLPR